MPLECVLDTNVYLVAVQPNHQYFETSKKIAAAVESGKLIPLTIKTIREEINAHIEFLKRNPYLGGEQRKAMVNVITKFYSYSKELAVNSDVESIVKDLLQHAIPDRADAEIIAASAFHKKKFVTYDWRTILKQPFEKRIQDVLRKHALRLNWEDSVEFSRRFRP